MEVEKQRVGFSGIVEAFPDIQSISHHELKMHNPSIEKYNSSRLKKCFQKRPNYPNFYVLTQSTL